MATAHSTVKARSGRNRSRKSPGTPESATRPNTPVKRSKPHPAQVPRPHAKGRSTPENPGSQVANRGARIRVRGRLQAMIQAEMFNLEKAAAILRCLVLSMDTQPVDVEPPYFPDIVEAAGDLIERSLVDLDVLHNGYIRDPLMAARRIER